MNESTQFSKPETWEPSFTPASSPLTSNPSHTDVPHGGKKTVNYQTVITQKLKCWLYLLFFASLTLELKQRVWGCLPPSFLPPPSPTPPHPVVLEKMGASFSFANDLGSGYNGPLRCFVEERRKMELSGGGIKRLEWGPWDPREEGSGI